MANEKRLIDANALTDACRKTLMVDVFPNWKNMSNEERNVAVKIGGVFKRMHENAPTVVAVVLPCKIDDDVYIIPSKVNFELNVFSGLKINNRVYHQKVAEIVFLKDCWYVSGNADKEFGTGRVLLDRFYKETWFLTREEAETALAKMDGGNEE